MFESYESVLPIIEEHTLPDAIDFLLRRLVGENPAPQITKYLELTKESAKLQFGVEPWKPYIVYGAYTMAVAGLMDLVDMCESQLTK